MNRKLTVAVFAATLAAAPAALAQSEMPTTMIRPTPNSSPGQSSLPRTQTEMPGPSATVRPYADDSIGVSGARARAVPDVYGPDARGNHPSAMNRPVPGYDSPDRAMSGVTAPRGAMTGATGTAGSMSGTMEGGRVLVDIDDIPNIDQRRGPGQNRLELMQTTLLNNFAAFGFEGVRDFRKVGPRYVADVSRGGQWMTVEMDPDTGTISTLR